MSNPTAEHPEPDWQEMIQKDKANLAKEARKLLAKTDRKTCSPKVLAHWVWISELSPEQAAN